MVVHFERPEEEAIEDFQKFLTSNNLKIKSVNEDTVETEPANLDGAQYGSSNTQANRVRIKGVVEPSGDDCKVLVTAVYMDPASGEWKRAMYSQVFSGRGYSANSQGITFRKLQRLFVVRYSDDNILFENSKGIF